MDTEHARELLARERARIERELAGLGTPESDGDRGDFDQGDTATDMVDAEVGEAVGAPLREELGSVERAEQRLAEGTYGLSVETGDRIPDARLEAIPWAERTAEEQARYELGRA